MTIDIAVKGPLLEAFYLKLEEDGWNFKECESLFAWRRTLELTVRAAGPNEKDAPLLVDFQVVISEFKRLDPRCVFCIWE
jgi:farnesyl-diphosphate farnesyltransferase